MARLLNVTLSYPQPSQPHTTGPPTVVVHGAATAECPMVVHSPVTPSLKIGEKTTHTDQ